MPDMNNKTIYYMLGGLIVFFGLYMYWATSDIPLPKNAKKAGDMIHVDIGGGLTNKTEVNEAVFIVPSTFTPKVAQELFTFNFKFPEATPYTGDEFPIPPDRIRVVVRHHRTIESARSVYILRHAQTKDGNTKKSTPYLVDSRDGVEIYKYDYGKAGTTTIGTYYKFVANDGNSVLLQDPGSSAKAYQVDRTLSSHIELTYMLQKHLVRDPEHLIEDVTALDNAVLNIVKSFQAK